MGNTYTRQSSFTDGDVITADLFNNEYDQLLAAFAASTGHTHDGTAAEGGPITKLLGTAITIGDGTTGTDITVTFDGETNDGELKWMEDEDYFEFSDDILVASTEKIQFGDTATFIQQSSDGVLRIDGEATVDINASTAVLISNDLKLDSDSAILGFGADNDTTLTHTDGTGLTLNSTNKLTFGDAASFVQQSSDGVLRIDGEATIDLNASTAVTVSNDLKLDSDAAVLGFGVDNDVTLTHVADTGLLLNGTSVIQFNDASQSIGAPSATVLDINATDEIELNATLVDINANVEISGTLTVAGALDFGDLDISNVGSIALDTITNDGTNITLDSSGDIILDAEGADIFLKNDGTTYGSLTDSSGELVIKSGSTPTTAMTFSGANVTIAGDLTISGDDLTMATNTAGALLIADGTNFNPTLITSLSEIGTAADDDVLLAIDTSGGGLKKITRSTIIAGTGVAGNISNVIEDTSPQLGGNLDTNDFNILIDDAHFIGDENGNEQLVFQTTSSAVNQFEITNAATGNPPQLAATGGDSNIDLNLAAKGTGHVTIYGNTNPGTIQFNCENNTHGVQLKSPAHSVGSSAVLTLPSTTGTLIGTGDTGTLPVAAIDIDGATDIGEAIVDADLFIVDNGAGGTNRKVAASRIKTYIGSPATAADDISLGDAAVTIATSSGNITIDAQAGDADIIFKGTDGSSDITALTLDMSDAGTAIFNHDIKIADDGQIGSASAADAMIISSGGIVTFKDDILIKDGGTIGVASTADAITISSAGLVTIKDDIVLKSGGTIGGSNDTDLLTLGNAALTVAGTLAATTGTFSGILKTDDTTEATSTTDGSLQTDGGLSVVKDVVIGDDLKLLSDSSVIHFGADSEVTLTHVADTGLTLKHTATADDKPIVLTLQTGETDMAANDVIGKIAFQAPDEGTGTDAILVSAAIQAVAEGDFSSSSNATRLEFHTGASEAAASKMTLSSAGVLDVDGGITVDNITIDGTEIDLSSGDLTLDVDGDIILDADGEEVIFKNGSTNIGHVSLDSSNLTIKSLVQDKDIIFKGDDGGSEITALTMDMSDAGRATFNDVVKAENFHADYQALSGTTPTIDADTGGGFSLTVSGATTFTFSSVESGKTVGFYLEITGNGSSVDYETNQTVKFAGGTAPDAPANGETDVLVFITRDGGSNWYGALAIDAAA